jgi:hypothetical protein
VRDILVDFCLATGGAVDITTVGVGERGKEVITTNLTERSFVRGKIRTDLHEKLT